MATSLLCLTSAPRHTPRQGGPAHKGKKSQGGRGSFCLCSGGGGAEGQAVGPELRPREAERSTQGHTTRSVPSRPGWGSSCWPGVHRAGRALPHRRSLCPETQEGPGPQPCHPAREPPVCHHCPERPDRSVHLQRPLTYPAQHPGHSQAPQQGDDPSSPAPTIPALNPPQNLIGAPTATWCGPRSVLPGGLHGNLTWLVFLPRNPIKEGSLVVWSPSTLSGQGKGDTQPALSLTAKQVPRPEILGPQGTSLL